MKTFFLGAFATVLFGIVAALGLSFAGLLPVAATSNDSAPVAWFLHSTYEKAVQRNAANITVPSDLNSETRVLKGAKNFAAMCAGCHTAPGKRATAASLGLNPPPPKAVELAAELSAAERFWVISNGVKMTGMPAFGPAHEDSNELWALVAFTATLPGLNAASYDAIVAKAREKSPAGDGHNHSHGGDETAGNTKATGHGQPTVNSGNHHSNSASENYSEAHAAPAMGSATEPHEPITLPPVKSPVVDPAPFKPSAHDHSGHSH